VVENDRVGVDNVMKQRIRRNFTEFEHRHTGCNLITCKTFMFQMHQNSPTLMTLGLVWDGEAEPDAEGEPPTDEVGGGALNSTARASCRRALQKLHKNKIKIRVKKRKMG
jgi:hypothetical protein